ncbi:MAG: phosphodiesterase [Gammaproteobacteria bacterium]|nr:phosphodiesterase [Gammaproteobacteria bacterium]
MHLNLSNDRELEREPVIAENGNRVIRNTPLPPLDFDVGDGPENTNLVPATTLGRDLTAALQRAGVAGEETALLVLRINDYRKLTETLGESFGIELVQHVEARLRDRLRIYDVAERVSDDEFAIVLGRLDKLDDVTSVASRLIESCSGGYDLGELKTRIKTAVGIALYPPDGEEPDELLRYARVALQGADEGDRSGCHIFSRELLERQQRRVWMEAELERALLEDRFTLHYQPQYDADSRKIVGMEALVRLRSETGELIPPDDFIPIAENNGFIVTLGQWVIREACRQLALWREAGCGPLRMAVNVSPLQLVHEDLVHVITEAIEASGLVYSDLELEITEQQMLEHSTVVEKVLGELHGRGVRIAIDDFGTGYSSFVYLSRLPLNLIKMDRSFIANITTDPRAVQVATAMIVMARELGFEIILEGVETAEQQQFLKTSGCDFGQGFGLARPQAPDAIEKLLLEPQYLKIAG